MSATINDLNSRQIDFIALIQAELGAEAVVSSRQLIDLAKSNGYPKPQWIWGDKFRHLFKRGRGEYIFPNNLLAEIDEEENESEELDFSCEENVDVDEIVVDSDKETSNALSHHVNSFVENLIPQSDPLFVSFGSHTTIMQVLKSKMFYPVYIAGLSGNGKTLGSVQACAKLRRPMIRVNLTTETDEDDLIGGFRLVDGETKFFKGPVIRAMELGAVLLLDEIDKADPCKAMCLQSILEGTGYFIKKTGEFIPVTPGFNIIATANTKGKGSDDGQFLTSNILDEAFLERFCITIEQEYPSKEVEARILNKLADSLDITDNGFIGILCEWSKIIREAYLDDIVGDLVSTRRLTHIMKSYKIFDKRLKSVELCINRFDDDTKRAFKDFYTKLDAVVDAETKSGPWDQQHNKKYQQPPSRPNDFDAIV